MISFITFEVYMNSILAQFNKLDTAINTFAAIGIEAIDALCDIGNISLPVSMLADMIGDKNDDLAYFFFECDADFDKFNENILVGTEHPDVHNLKSLYYYITRGKE